MGCPEEEVVFDGLFVSLTADPLPDGARVDRLVVEVRQVVPEGGLSLFLGADRQAHRREFPLPESVALHEVAHVVRVRPGALIAGDALMVILGLVGETGRVAWVDEVSLGTNGLLEAHLSIVSPSCDRDEDGVKDCGVAGCCEGAELLLSDCADGDALANPLAVLPECKPCAMSPDLDCDGTPEPCVDADGDQAEDCDEAVDCDPNDPAVHAGAVEACDGVDNDCDGDTDEVFPDLDHDELADCVDPDRDGDGTPNTTDCEPENASVYLGAPEECNGEDDDCDGVADEGLTDCLEWVGDWDGDGQIGPVDCNEYDSRIYPDSDFGGCCDPQLTEEAAPDVVLAQCDFDCDGVPTFCGAEDPDGDGAATSQDCDSDDPTVYPGAPEKCGDGIDQDCALGDAECDTDADGDGFDPPSGPGEPGDCDDSDPDVHPWAEDVCNGKDDDCDGVVDGGNPGGGEPCPHPFDEDGVCGEASARGTKVCVPNLYFAPADARAQAPGEAAAVICVGYYAAPAAELKCDGQDEDCDGEVDEDFQWFEQHPGPGGEQLVLGIGDVCGTGQCAGGSVVCHKSAAGQGPEAQLWCDGLAAAVPEQVAGCDGLDNDCDGVVDGHSLPVNLTTCKQLGVCAEHLPLIEATCLAGAWKCAYPLPGYEEDEAFCDGLDNDCDGTVDEGASWQSPETQLVVALGEPCDGVGACGEGIVACSADGTGTATCSTNPNGTASEAQAELCDDVDHDCDGDPWAIAWEGIPLGQPCDGTGECGTGVVECATGGTGAATCSTNPDGPDWVPKIELCDGADNDCDGLVDEDFVGLGEPCESGSGGCANLGVQVCSGGGGQLVCDVTGKPPGTFCEDGDQCTLGDFCTGGDDSACVGTPYVCDDGRPCTEDECVEGGNCAAVLAEGWCLLGGTCTAEGAIDPLTGCGICDPAASAGAWSPLPVGTPCAKLSSCSEANACDGQGACAAPAGATDCDDGLPCTLDLCMLDDGAPVCESGGLIVEGSCFIGGLCYPEGAPQPGDPCQACLWGTDPLGWSLLAGNPCQDGDSCTGLDTCAAGGCQGTPIDCDDENACTTDSCDTGSGGCQHAPLDVGSCEDGDPCTLIDTCVQGVCTGAGPVTCDDGNPCTADSCEPGVGCIAPLADGVLCDDEDPCTEGDACAAGVCAGTPMACDDGDQCTNDACVDGECAFAKHEDSCDDGDACTTGDVCKPKGDCKGTPMDCKDDDPCTDEACDAGACVTSPKSGNKCDDGDSCTTGDRCANGLCVPNEEIPCEDDNECTTESCTGGGECKHDPAAGQACDDGVVCTTGDVCGADAVCAGVPDDECAGG